MPVAFSDKYLRSVQPDPARRLELVDSSTPGLRLRVTPAGAKTFIVWTTDNLGKARSLTLGRYLPSAPEVTDVSLLCPTTPLTLVNARALAVQVYAGLKVGKDVAADRRAERAAQQEEKEHAAAVPTLAELLKEYEMVAVKVAVWNNGSAQRQIERVFPELLAVKVDAITKDHLHDALSAYPSKSYASRTRAYLSGALDWAAGRGPRFRQVGRHRKLPILTTDIRDVGDPQPAEDRVPRNRVLSDEELTALWRTLDDSKPRDCAFRWLLLTGARKGELVAMRWEHVDLEAGTWFKPKVKTPRGRQRSQLLPLPPALIEWLRKLPSAALGEGPVFDTSQNWDRTTKQLYAETGTSGWQRHDLRRTAATLMRRLRIDVVVVEQILAHADPLKAAGAGASARHYMVEELQPQREALARWHSHLIGLQGLRLVA